MSCKTRTYSKLNLPCSRLQDMKSNLLESLEKAQILDPEQVLGQVSSLDPTAVSGKYLLTPWIINQIVNKTIIWPEDQSRVQNSINWWWGSKHKLQPNQRQLNRTITLHDLEDWQETLQPTKREVIREHKTQGAEVLYSKPPYTLLKITTPEAAAIYGKGTKWCTTEAETCSEYLEQGPLFILQKNGQAYIQYHLEERQVKQADDRDITKKQKQELARVLSQAGLLDVGTKFILGITTFSKQDMQVITSSAEYSYWYARNILRDPFPAGEAAIASNARYSYLYALDTLGKKPFPAGEPAIASSAQCSYLYACQVLRAPFPAGEPTLARSAAYSYLYALNVLKDPNPETWGARYLAQHGVKS